MSLPASSVPVAVLVLAWDETTPAVRALVEATEAPEPVLDSVVVLVPAGPANEELTQEEFLPLEDSLLSEALLPLSPAATELVPAATTAEPEAAAAAPAPAAILDTLPPVAAGSSVALATTAAAPPLPGLSWELPPIPGAMLPTPGLVGQETFATLSGLAVHVLRLSDYSLASLAAYSQQALPAPTWVGAAAVPAAPYVGSLAVAAALLPPLSSSSYEAAATESVSATTTFPFTSSAFSEEESATPRVVPAPPSPSYLPTELPAAPDAELDSTPVPAVDEPAPAAADADESTTELSEEAADELAEPFTVDVTPVQAGWPEALASLQEPAAFAEAPAPIAAAAEPEADSPIENEPVAYAALRPRAQQFDAPNLNFQVIQYARFAVPMALAAQPFSVIYAPAWPTWLAAQELRQRTGRPLVLHIATLAAQDEPLALAAGWPAEIQRQALHQADLILTETPALAYRLRRELDLPAHRVRPVPAADAAAIAQALSTAHVH